ncbi:MAG: hypothetical protein QNK04_26185 [Myxococcota bacterium]|nr:hypothetical protein [Myxococcota bacterium]
MGDPNRDLALRIVSEEDAKASNDISKGDAWSLRRAGGLTGLVDRSGRLMPVYPPPMGLRWVLTALVLGQTACGGSWAPPHDPAIAGSDSRECDAASLCVDLAVAVDTSLSASLGPGEIDSPKYALVGYPKAAAGSRLWVALDGLERALLDLDAAKLAVSLIGFAGDGAGTNPAGWIEASLTNDFEALGRASSRMRSRGAGGSSCHALFVVVGAADEAATSQFGSVISAAGGRVLRADEAGDVAKALAQAARMCS